MPIRSRLRHELIHYQLNEITEYCFYNRLAASVPTPQNRAVLKKIAGQELRHYQSGGNTRESMFVPAVSGCGNT